MTDQSEMIRIIDLIEKLTEKRNEGDGMYPYASFEYNGRYPRLYVKTGPDKWHFFTDEEHVGKIGRNYRPLPEGIKLLEELVND